MLFVLLAKNMTVLVPVRASFHFLHRINMKLQKLFTDMDYDESSCHKQISSTVEIMNIVTYIVNEYFKTC